ncbi:hypothetical protein L2E82_52163 [Cichorium intybus]|nr:hypothetical protein L2E82_52163 [Cichorium intybus]
MFTKESDVFSFPTLKPLPLQPHYPSRPFPVLSTPTPKQLRQSHVKCGSCGITKQHFSTEVAPQRVVVAPFHPPGSTLDPPVLPAPTGCGKID